MPSTRDVAGSRSSRLLDLVALRDPFARAFGDAAPLGEWFARLHHASLVATLTDSYEDFASSGRRALEAAAARRGLDLPDADRDAILGTMRRLPAHPDVPGALERLRSAGFPLATLTNSSGDLVRAQLEHAGLLELFDRVLSVEEVRRYKPAPEPYLMATERLGVPPRRWGWWRLMIGTCGARYGPDARRRTWQEPTCRSCRGDHPTWLARISRLWPR